MELELFVLRQKFLGVVPYEPYRQTERLAAQQGIFLCPIDGDATFAANLAAMKLTTEAVTKIVIANDARARILDRLRLMNVTTASLFPGLDGYAKSFKTAFVEEPETSRAMRALRKALSDRLRGGTIVV